MRQFALAFIQVALVSANTVFISKGYVFWMAVTSFGINLVWTHNVKRISFGCERDRILYASGATTGCIAGYFASALLI